MEINSQDIKKINYQAQGFLSNDVTYWKFNLDDGVTARAAPRLMDAPFKGSAGNNLLGSPEDDGTEHNLSP